MAEVHLRQAARAVLLDPSDRVLLCRYEVSGRRVWATVGGGIEAGESPSEAVARELLEEVGLPSPAIGPHIWDRTHLFDIGGGFAGQQEVFYLVRTEAVDPAPVGGWEALHAEGVKEMRWWGPEEIASSEETFAPRSLGWLVQSLIDDGPPSKPFDVGV